MDLNTVQSPLNYTSNRRPDWESLVLKVNQTWPVLKVMTLFSFCPHPPTVNQSDGDYWPTVFCRTILRAFSMPGEPAVVALRCLMAAAWPGWSLLQPLEKERSTTCRWPSEPIPAAQVSVILVIKTFLIFLTQKLTTSFLDQFSRFRNSAAEVPAGHTRTTGRIWSAGLMFDARDSQQQSVTGTNLCLCVSSASVHWVFPAAARSGQHCTGFWPTPDNNRQQQQTTVSEQQLSLFNHFRAANSHSETWVCKRWNFIISFKQFISWNKYMG